MTTERANALIGTTSLSPVEDKVVKLRNSNSIHDRALLGSTAAVNEPGLDRLDHDEDVGEAPRHQGERRTDREELVGRHDVVGEHVADQPDGDVEVERRLEAGAPRAEPRVVEDALGRRAEPWPGSPAGC